MSAVALRSVLIPAIQTSSLRHAHTGRSMAARIANGEIRSMHTVVMCRPLHASGMALLEARHDVTIRTLDRLSAQDLAAAIPGAHAVLVGLEKVDEALLAAAPELRIVSRFGVGYDTVDIPACTRRGVVVGVTNGGNENEVNKMKETIEEIESKWMRKKNSDK